MSLLELVGDNDLPGIDRYLQKVHKERGKARSSIEDFEIVFGWFLTQRRGA
jgi:hypothetical protein